MTNIDWASSCLSQLSKLNQSLQAVGAFTNYVRILGQVSCLMSYEGHFKNNLYVVIFGRPRLQAMLSIVHCEIWQAMVGVLYFCPTIDIILLTFDVVFIHLIFFILFVENSVLL